MPVLLLPRPPSSTHQAILQSTYDLRSGEAARLIIENWTTAIVSWPRWTDRSEMLLIVQRDLMAGSHGLRPDQIGFILAGFMSAILENFAEDEIACHDQAAFYLLTSHKDWRAVACQWLMPVHKTSWLDWVGTRPIYKQAAGLVATIHSDVPWWAWEIGA